MALGQDNLDNDPDYKKVYDTFLPVYTHHIGSFGINTNGWGLFYEYGFGLNKGVKHLVTLEFSVLKDAKERTSSVPIIINNRQQIARYIYGKQNIVYPVKLSYGRQHVIALPNKYKGLEVQWHYKAGLIMGLTRPYYLTVQKIAETRSDNINDQGLQFMNIPYSSKDSLLFLSVSNILDYSGFSFGWDQLRLDMGVSASLGLRLDFAPMLKMNGSFGIEITGITDLYFQNVVLLVPLATAPPKNFFLQGRLGVFVGSFSKRPSRHRLL